MPLPQRVCGELESEGKQRVLVADLLSRTNLIAIEIFHSLADAGGAFMLLKTLVYEYLLLKGYRRQTGQSNFDQRHGAFDDRRIRGRPAYLLTIRTTMLTSPEEKAFIIPGTPDRRQQHRLDFRNNQHEASVRIGALVTARRLPSIWSLM
ncbi:MAG: hypothetical protein MZU97_16705 [Bacillus subtilis]|nr:hypothetical protein [Bacillus subtilis]